MNDIIAYDAMCDYDWLISLIRQRVKSKGISYRDLARLVDIDASNLSKILKKKHFPSVLAIFRIMVVLDIDIRIVKHYHDV